MDNTIAKELAENAIHLTNSRNAIFARGGEIAPDAGWASIPDAVLFLPTDKSLAIVQEVNKANKVFVQPSSESVARIDSVGGKTRVVPGTNLIPFAGNHGVRASTEVNWEESFVHDSFLLPDGSCRFYCESVPDIADSCIDVISYLVTSNDGVYFANGYYNSGDIFTTPDKYAYIKCGSASRSATDEDIQIAQSGGSGAQKISFNEARRIYIQGKNADGSPTFCDISIDTKTRVKVTVSDRFETYNGSEEFITESTEFILLPGKYNYYWANTSTEEWQVEIRVDQYIPDSIEVTVYPMVYSVPNDSPEWIRTEYEPYEEHLEPSPVTEIVSKGKNLVPDTVYDISKWQVHPITPTNRLFPLNITKEGLYAISFEGTLNGETFIYLNRSTDGGVTFTATGAAFNQNGMVQAGYLITDNSILSPRYFEHKEGYKWVLWMSGSSQENLDSIKNIQIEYIAPDSSAPRFPDPTEYTSYSAEPIDTVAIPKAVKNDASWGHGFSYTRDGDTSFVANEYDFTEKKYTQYIPEKVILDGSGGKKFVGNAPVDIPRFYFPLQGKCKDNASVIAPNFKTKYADAVGNVYLYGDKAYFFLPSEITTVADANNWLKNNPIEFVYAIAEPTITQIEDDSLTPRFVKVEGGGEIEFKNKANADVPSKITFVRKV